jgi:hypothetical protein
MAWGQWMVPELTSETEFRLRAHELEIRQAVDTRPAALADLTVALSWQAAAQESIIRKATRRIAELEAREAVGQRETGADWIKVARELAPRPWWRGLGR